MKIILSIGLIVLCCIVEGNAQNNSISVVAREGDIYAGMKNELLIVDRFHNIPAELVKFYFYDVKMYEDEALPIVLEVEKIGNFFVVQPPSIGQLKIVVTLNNQEFEHKLHVKAIPTVVSFTGYGQTKVKMTPARFKVQQGVMAYVDYEKTGLCARCVVDSFELWRINSNNEVEKRHNSGARFDEETRGLIDKAMSGDVYIFQDVAYRCATDTKVLDDTIILVTIK